VARRGVRGEEIWPIDALAEVLPELALGGHEEDQAVLRAVVLVADRLLHAVVADRAARTLAVAVVARHLVLGALVGLVTLDAVPVERRGGVALCDLEAASDAGGARADDRRADAERGVERAGVDADRRVGRNRREALDVVRPGHAGPGVVGDPVARHVLVRPGHAVAGGGAGDELRVYLVQPVVAQPAGLQGTRPHALRAPCRA